MLTDKKSIVINLIVLGLIGYLHKIRTKKKKKNPQKAQQKRGLVVAEEL